MTSRWLDLGDWLRLAVPLAAAGIVYWVLARSGSRQIPVADGPQDEPYRVYTRDHDLSLRARDVPSALTADGSDRAGGWVSRDPAVWRKKVDSADRILSGISPDHAPILRNAFSSSYRVDGFYKRSRSVEDLTEPPAALSTLIADIVRQPAGTE